MAPLCRSDEAIFTGETGDAIRRLAGIRISQCWSLMYAAHRVCAAGRTLLKSLRSSRSIATHYKERRFLIHDNLSDSRQLPSPAQYALHGIMGSVRIAQFGKCTLRDVCRRVCLYLSNVLHTILMIAKMASNSPNQRSRSCWH